MTPDTNLVSFVLRFVCDPPTVEPSGLVTNWHGMIRHVQSNTEQHFTRWAEAEAFIQQHVQLGQDEASVTNNVMREP
jgi:hypothetical protein